MTQRSVADLADNTHGMADVVKSTPGLSRAAQLIDSAIAAQLQSAPLDGKYREVGAVELMDLADAQGVKASDVMFVLNVLPKHAYTFGGRAQGKALTGAEVVGLLREVAQAERDAKPLPVAAQGVSGVHRFTAECLQAN